MPRKRSPERDKAYEIYKENKGNITNRKIAELLQLSEKTISGWKCKDSWDDKMNGVLQTNIRSTPKKKKGKRGAPKGSRNAAGHGAPVGNQNARKHGLFSRYLPKETLAIIEEMSQDPLDLLWDQIQIANAGIIRAQQIMYVKNKKDKTIEKVEEKFGNVSGEKWEVQQAWDKQGSFLQAQAKAQAELRNLIKQYDEMLHKNWGLATKEQKARVQLLKAQVEKTKGADNDVLKVEISKLDDLVKQMGGDSDE